jgi:hypothetical protein
MEEVAVEVVQVNKTIYFFKTMAIVSLNMGNLNIKVSSCRNKICSKGR